MLVNAASQSHFKFGRLEQSPAGHAMRKSPASYHRRSVSCLAVASHHEHYNHPSYYLANDRLYDTVEISDGSASPTYRTRHVKRRSDGAISLEQLQRGLSSAGIASINAASAESKAKSDGSLNGKLAKVNVISPVNTPRRSLLSDLLNSQTTPSRLEQAANRRRMLKSMRRYSVDASEMDFCVSRPSTRATPLEGIPAEDEGPMLPDGRQGFSATPMVRYLRNPCHATVKTKLQPSAYRTLARRGNDGDEETPDYFGAEDRVW